MNAEESPEAGVAEEAQEDAGSALRLRVLQEIARVAAEKGRTPGCVSFRKETGLSAALWHGLIWARWSDAVREAGLVPNIKRGKLTDEQLLAGYAEAMRKHGRIPTDAELLLYRKSGSALPRHATYRSHFDSKGEPLRRLREWCGENAGRADIAAMLENSDTGPKKPRVTGAVYLLRSGPSYKIGCSKKPVKRMRSIAVGLPVPARVVHVIETDDPFGIEAYWHRRFARKRKRGEWFRLSAEDVAAFRERSFQ